MKRITVISAFLFIFSIACICNTDKPDSIYIDAKTISKIKPKIEKWLHFYSIDIAGFKLISDVKYSMPDTTSIHYKEYGMEDDFYDPQLYDYSHNKKRYVNILPTSGVARLEDGKCYYSGGDDCQEIYLIDRGKKENFMIIWNGMGSFSEAAFWIDNNLLIIPGRSHNGFEIHLFDLKNKYHSYYEYETDTKDITNYFFDRVNLKERGIVNSLDYD